jgi:hypothetical protein
VETSDILYFILYPKKKKRIDQKIIDTWLRAYVLDSITTTNGEVGISGSRSSSCKYKTFYYTHRGGPETATGFTEYML